jgi:hypothetical protein
LPALRRILDASASSRRQGTTHVPVLRLRAPRSSQISDGRRLVEGRATAAQVSPPVVISFVRHAQSDYRRDMRRIIDSVATAWALSRIFHCVAFGVAGSMRRARSVRGYSSKPARWAWRGSFRSIGSARIGRDVRRTGSRSKIRARRPWSASGMARGETQTERHLWAIRRSVPVSSLAVIMRECAALVGRPTRRCTATAWYSGI